MKRIAISLVIVLILGLLFVGAMMFGGAPPVVATSAATNINTTEAVLNGYLGDFGTHPHIAEVYFLWGTTRDGPYPNKTTPQEMNNRGAFSFNLTGLTPDTTYYFKAKAVCSFFNGTDIGDETSFITPGEWTASTQVTFPDVNLEAAIREAINNPEGPIYFSGLESLTTLEAQERGISDLTGLEYCVNLEYCDLRSNNISDISPLVENSGLSVEDTVYLNGNPLSTTSINVYIPQLDIRGVDVRY